MKRKMLIFITTILITILFAGCGNKVKNEEELLTDLVANSSFYMVEGSEVTELSIIKRLTDEESKTDKVYVSINIDHEAATASQAYIMYYTCYNEGWLLDNIEEYYGDEVEWITVPKNVPTNEQIMEQLINYSNSQIDASYAEQFISEELTHTYFFEEGKYCTEIYSGNMVSELEYSCFVTTYRNFEYVAVREEQLLRFMFDCNTYEWYLYDDEILWFNGEAYFQGTWRVPTNGAILSLDLTQMQTYDLDAYAKYYAVCTIDDKTIDYSFTLTFPSTKSIDASWNNVGDIIWGPVSLYIEVAPDMIWCYDNFYECGFKLEPINLDVKPYELKSMGIVDMSIDESLEPYRETARDVLNAIFVEPDLPYLREMWEPNSTQNLSKIEEYICDGERYATSMTHISTEESSETIRSFFYLELWEDEEVTYDSFGVILKKKGEQLYVLDVEG